MKNKKIIDKLLSAKPDIKPWGKEKIQWDNKTFNLQLTGEEISFLLLILGKDENI